MAVYTQLEFDEIATLIAPMALGRLIRAEGIAAGVENTTYFVDTQNQHSVIDQYVLTIAETLSRTDLEFIASLMQILSARGLPVPAPAFFGNVFSARDAVLLIHGKPVLLVPRVAGTHPISATPALCNQLGETLAKLHLVTLDLHDTHESHRSLQWVETCARNLLPHLNKNDSTLLAEELAHLKDFVGTGTELPQAIIHGDLFRDNVLVEGEHITALIDFFSAGSGYVLLDLAIAVNDWCFDAEDNFDAICYHALISAYRATRQPQPAEVRHWGRLLRIAALRFWVSRLNEQLLAGTHAPPGRGKNPLPYRRLLLRHRRQPMALKP
ncbi:MAG: homoserine kinase [Spongiibacteraceae bacterium]